MEIELPNGMVAIIDQRDRALVSAYKWRAFKSRAGWYACTGQSGLGTLVFMHRLIAGAPDGVPVDHRDSDGLNNRRKNLRVCTHAQNMQNRKLRVDSSSGVKNVMWEGRYWRVDIKANGKRHRRCFQDFDEACVYAAAKRKELHGEFAYDANRDVRLQNIA